MSLAPGGILRAAATRPIYQDICPSDAGWRHLSFQARIMRRGEIWKGETEGNEYVIVLLGGNFSAVSSAGTWKTTGGRRDVFSGLPHALYLPPGTAFSLTAESDLLDLACGWCPCARPHPARLVTPADVDGMGIELRGGGNASRQILSILPPGSNCEKLVCVEVYTPSGNWSSYPPHKHDTRSVDADGVTLREAELEEIYFYKMDREHGFAWQKVYAADGSFREIVEARDNDVVMVRRGYHPMVAGYGYNVYYLNILAGTDQSLASTDDPAHHWARESWGAMDPRLPLVTREMNGRR